MANTFTSLTQTILAERVFNAFVLKIAPLTAFSTNFSAEAASRGDKIKVLQVDAAAAATAFAGTYSMQDTTASGLDVSLDQHYFVSWSLTDSEIVNRPQLEVERFVEQKAFALAKQVFQSVLGLVTAANFGSAGFTGLASAFDADDVVDLRTACSTAGMPDNQRALILDASYYAALLKDSAIQDASQSGSTDALREGSVQRLAGFDLYESSLVPANAENLKGLAVHPDAIAAAIRYLAPQDGHDYIEAMPLSRAESGITLGMRRWYDKDTGAMRTVLECLYGRRLINGNACKRIVSA